MCGRVIVKCKKKAFSPSLTSPQVTMSEFGIFLSGCNPKAIHSVVFSLRCRRSRVIDSPVKPICVVVDNADAVLAFTTQEGRSACRKRESERARRFQCREDIRDCSSCRVGEGKSRTKLHSPGRSTPCTRLTEFP